MRKYVFSSILGLSIVAGSLAAAAPASAAPTVWRNYATNGESPLFLTFPDTRGESLTVGPLSTLVSDNITAFGNASAANWLQGPYTTNWPQGSQSWLYMVTGVSNNNMSNGAAVIAWAPTGDANQSWYVVPSGFTDGGGAHCVSFHNANSGSTHDFVIGVPGNVTSGKAVIIWDFFNSQYGHPDQFWCEYTRGANGGINPT